MLPRPSLAPPSFYLADDRVVAYSYVAMAAVTVTRWVKHFCPVVARCGHSFE